MKFNFRVWDIKGKRFNYVELIEYLRIASTHDESKKFCPVDSSFHDSVIAQMYSSKDDKKGKRIFAGDIVKIHNKSENTKKEYWFPIYEVTWDGFEFGLKYLGGGGKQGDSMFTFRHYPKDLEIIGNIFESTIIIPK